MICACAHPRSLHEYVNGHDETDGLAGCYRAGCSCHEYSDATADECLRIVGESFRGLHHYGSNDWHGEASVWDGRRRVGRVFVDGASAEDVLRQLAAHVLEVRGHG